MSCQAGRFTEREHIAVADLHSALRCQALAHDALASLAVIQVVFGSLATGSTLGLCIWQFWASGPQRLLLLSLLRLGVLLCVGLVAYKAFGQRAHSFLGIQRPTLYRIALYLQLLWFTSELLLGSALLVFLPVLQGSELEYQDLRKTYWGKVVPACYMVGMAGCLCFITQLKNRRRVGKGGRDALSSSASLYTDCYEGVRYLGDAPAHAAGPPTVTCEIVLVQHQLDTNESVLFVHKKLRPIKTRPDCGTNYLPLLKPIIGKSFTSQQQQQQPAAPLPQQPSQQPPVQQIPLINLSFTTTTASQLPSHPSFTSPLQRLQHLTAASTTQQRTPSVTSSTQSHSLTSTCGLCFPGTMEEPAVAVMVQQRYVSPARSADGSSGARSISGMEV